MNIFINKSQRRAIFSSVSLLIIILLLNSQASLFAQNNSEAINTITPGDLKSHISFLASKELSGRATGEPGMEIATKYLETQAMRLGLTPANGDSYLQPYTLVRTSIDYSKSGIFISEGDNQTVINKPIYQIIPLGSSPVDMEGEVVFAGYGITSQKYKYDDFADIDVSGKIILIMNRAPMNEDGSECQFEEEGWLSTMNFNLKYMNLMYKKPKAILIVMDPKSGYRSLAEDSPGIASFLDEKLTMKGEQSPVLGIPGAVNLFIIHRDAAEAILEGTGHDLAQLQQDIDAHFAPSSYLIDGKTIRIKTEVISDEVVVNNVAGLVEGSDPILKNEIIVYSAHMDHLGTNPDGAVNFGADDDASGCAALLEIAEAYSSLKKKPARSILFLWVSAEEVGLFGSQFYTGNPLFPLENTIADINIDMIGRSRSEADSSASTPVTDQNSVFLIGGFQSSELSGIALQSATKLNITLDQELNDINHPLNLFGRSDHYNFVQKDVPVLFFTTGLHADYHTPRDVVSKIDFAKMTRITKALFDIGYTVAEKKERIKVDNPFSTWEK